MKEFSYVDVTIKNLGIEQREAIKVEKSEDRFKVWWDNEYGGPDVNAPGEDVILEGIDDI